MSLRKLAVRVTDRQYQLLTAASADSNHELSTVIRMCLTAENISKATEILKLEEQQRKAGQR